MAQGSAEHRGVDVGADQYLRQSLLTGTAIVLPVLITAFVFLIVVDFLSGVLNPLAIPIQQAIGDSSPIVPQLIAAVVLFVTILVVGAITESRYGGDRVKRGLDSVIARIPGIRSIYGPLEQISTMLVEGDARNFQEVVLVEYPKEGSYSVAFQTATPPEVIETATGDEEMLTVFMPMGPNPFMGGFIMHLAEDEVYDVDLSVEEGISSIVSFGVAVETGGPGSDVPIDVEGLEEPDGA